MDDELFQEALEEIAEIVEDPNLDDSERVEAINEVLESEVDGEDLDSEDGDLNSEDEDDFLLSPEEAEDEFSGNEPED